MRFLPALLLAAMTITPTALRADTLLFDLNPNVVDYFGPSGLGAGQGVAVTTTTLLSSFAFDLSSRGAPAQVTYQIFDGTDTTVLYSNTLTVSSTTQSWVVNPLNFTLNAGSSYFFAVQIPAFFNFGIVDPSITYSSNGLTAAGDGVSYSNDSASGSFTNAQLGLELSGTQVAAATPEPTSLMLFASGLVGGAVLAGRSRLV